MVSQLFHDKFLSGIETDFNRSREPLIFHGVLVFLTFNSVGPQSIQHIHDGHFGIKFVDTHVHVCYNIFLWISQFTFFYFGSHLLSVVLGVVVGII